MIKRKYSVAEIDQMRAALRKRHGPFGVPVAMLVDGKVVTGTMGPIQSSDGKIDIDFLQAEFCYNRQIEDELRTYILAGIDPQEL
jgi:hypothetical protein